MSAPRRRVLQAVTSMCRGGLSTSALTLLQQLDRARFEPHLVCTHFEGPHFAEARPLVESATVFTASGVPDKLRRLTRLMRTLRPHVVHARQEPTALIAARLAGVPVRMETVHLYKYWRQDGHRLLRALAWRCATRHVTNTEAERRLVARHVAEAQTLAIPIGMDLDALKPPYDRATVPCAAALGAGDLVIGAIGRLVEQKGLRYLIGAAPAVLRGCPSARFVIVGDGGLRADLEAQARDLGVAERVLFAGYQLEAYRWIGAMDVVVMPSLWESWGRTAMEAMATSVPVICSDIPGPVEFVRHEVDGLLVPPADSEALAAAILHLAGDAEARRRLGAAARESIRTRYTLDAMVRAYEAIYAGV